MANHSYIYIKGKIDIERVLDIAHQINNKMLGGLLDYSVDENYDGTKSYFFSLFKYDSINFWISDLDEFDTIIFENQHKIEVRHGHMFAFMWWIDRLFMHTIAHEFSGKLWYDGDIINPKLNTPTFADYIEIYQGGYSTYGDKLEHFKFLPQDTINKLSLIIGDIKFKN